MTLLSFGRKKLWFAFMLWRSKDVYYFIKSITLCEYRSVFVDQYDFKRVDRQLEISNGSGLK